MNAMPMVDLPVRAKEAPPPRAAKRKDSDFAPQLHEASRRHDDDNLAGAAAVTPHRHQADSPPERETEQASVSKPERSQPDKNSAGQKTTQKADSAAETGAGRPDAVGRSAAAPVAVAAQAASSDIPLVDAAVATDAEATKVAAQQQAEISAVAVEQEKGVLADVAVLADKKSVVAAVDTSVASTVQRTKTAKTKPTAVAHGEKTAAQAGAELLSRHNAAVTVDAKPVAAERSVVAAVAEQPVVATMEQGVGNGDGGADKTINDPRFAALLNKPEVPTTLHQRQSASGQSVAVATATDSADNSGAMLAVDDIAGTDGEIKAAAVADAQLVSALPRQENSGIEFGSQRHDVAVHNHQPQQAQHQLRSDTVVHLKNGISVPESHIVEQTIHHLSLHSRGDSSSITIKLHPEELGELHLRMVMEGDQLKVHLHAQTQQVQEVLERNFPRLRDSLQDNGVLLDQFQVSYDSGDSQSWQQFSQQQQESGSSAVMSVMAEIDDDSIVTLPVTAVPASEQGLSVRV